jgi:hypothetical protein
MVAYLFQAPQGVVGDVTRPSESNIEAVFMGATPPLAYGTPVKFDANGNIIKVVAADAAGVFAGIITRDAPGISGAGSTDDFSATGYVPNTHQAQGLLVRGYATVLCTVGTPVRGGPVFMCNNTAGGAIGDLQATTSANNVQLTSCSWAVSGKDANNLAEIRVNA